jgi:hypothetical protein
MTTQSDDASHDPEPAPEDDEATDPRVSGAFRAWLEALATDPDAATAAAMAYEALEPEGRDAWLDAIEAESPSLAVPVLALYAPLMGVETDGARRARIDAAVAVDPRVVGLSRAPRALTGRDASGDCVAAIVIPLYLDFVELLICRYQPDVGVTSALRGPLLRASEVWGEGCAVHEIAGVELSEAPFAYVIEGLAHALVADRRRGRPPPEPLRTYDFLFAPDLGDPAATIAAVAAQSR